VDSISRQENMFYPNKKPLDAISVWICIYIDVCTFCRPPLSTGICFIICLNVAFYLM